MILYAERVWKETYRIKAEYNIAQWLLLNTVCIPYRPITVQSKAQLSTGIVW